MLGMMCVVFLLLVGTIAALVYVRRRKTQQQQLTASAPPSFVTAAHYSPDGDDMPDLNLLVHTPDLPPAVPAPVAATPPPTTVSAPPAPIRSARKGTFTIMPKDGSSTEAVEVLTILRDVMDGKLLVQMGEATYHNVNSNAEFKERFNKLMREVGQMVTKPATVTPSDDESEAQNPSVETEEAALPSVSDLMQSNEPTFLAPKKPTPPPTYAPSGTVPGDLPSFKLEDNPMQKLIRWQKADLPPVPVINIAGAIEAYLQHKLKITPEYANHSIHIYPAPGGGVSIEVDGKYFEAVSDVTDPAIREFLSDTITEWQERH
jgi:hypothetical protein